MKYLSLSLIALLWTLQAICQVDEPRDYLPFVREGVKWINERVEVNNGDTTCYYYTYELKGHYSYPAWDGDVEQEDGYDPERPTNPNPPKEGPTLIDPVDPRITMFFIC